MGKFRDAHFAVFPLELAETCILAGTNEGDMVIDPFIGSGTTAAAARETKRHFLGIDLMPAYVQMARDRLAKMQVPLF